MQSYPRSAAALHAADLVLVRFLVIQAAVARKVREGSSSVWTTAVLRPAGAGTRKSANDEMRSLHATRDEHYGRRCRTNANRRPRKNQKLAFAINAELRRGFARANARAAQKDSYDSQRDRRKYRLSGPARGCR